jgi:hypothetical protein
VKTEDSDAREDAPLTESIEPSAVFTVVDFVVNLRYDLNPDLGITSVLSAITISRAIEVFIARSTGQSLNRSSKTAFTYPSNGRSSHTVPAIKAVNVSREESLELTS